MEKFFESFKDSIINEFEYYSTSTYDDFSTKPNADALIDKFIREYGKSKYDILSKDHPMIDEFYDAGVCIVYGYSDDTIVTYGAVSNNGKYDDGIASYDVFATMLEPGHKYYVNTVYSVNVTNKKKFDLVGKLGLVGGKNAIYYSFGKNEETYNKRYVEWNIETGIKHKYIHMKDHVGYSKVILFKIDDLK